MTSDFMWSEIGASKEFSSHQEETRKNKRGEKMRQMRRKMTLTRQNAETHKERNMIVMKMKKPKTYKGQAIIDSIDVTKDEIQEQNELVV